MSVNKHVHNKLFFLICIVLVVLLCLVFFNARETTKVQYIQDSIFYKERDSVIRVIDTSKVKIVELNKIYEKESIRVDTMPIDSAYIFWANYIQRFSMDNNSPTDTIK